MTDFSLTTGNDTIVTPSSGSTVYATAGTLNAGDSLTGGAGIDVLQLVGSGTFRVDQLASLLASRVSGSTTPQILLPTSRSAPNQLRLIALET